MDASLAIRIQQLSIQFLPFLIAVIFHEWAHGFVAYRWGDRTALEAGRMTLNPVPHIDPLGTLVFPIVCMLSGASVLFGWAKPVPINPARFRRAKPGLFCVAIAGVSMNFLLALISAIAACAILKWMPRDSYAYEPLQKMTVISVQLNFMLGLFNLVPIPPLDGSKIIEVFLPRRAIPPFERFGRFASIALMLTLFTGFSNRLFAPLAIATEVLTSYAVGLAALVLRIPNA
jgi:Zn-dependent protease